MEKRIYNFSAGPAALPLPALEEAQRDLLALPGVGMSIMEISHRSKQCLEVFESCEANLRKLLSIPDSHKVLFLHGGASLQFSMVPINLLRGSGKPADYIITGSWAKKAIKEAQREGETNVAWDGSGDNFKRVPKDSELQLSSDAAYCHYTSNETIQGIEFDKEPDTGDVPLICDASSNFLSKPLAMDRYGILYAGAQKNAGPAGVAIVIMREDMIERFGEETHAMLDYRNAIDKQSMYNTPPVFAVYMVGLVAKWLVETIGGLDKMQKINKDKAQLLYDAIDQSGGFYKGHAEKDSRSAMNVTWTMENSELEQEFISSAQAQGLSGLKGHRSVGGLRASIYNAMPVAGCETLRDFMLEFQKNKG